MPRKIRRVVTGHDDNGKAIVAMDGEAAAVTSSRPNQAGTIIWSTESFPVDNTVEGDLAHIPTSTTHANGTVFRVVKPALINNQTLEPTEIAGFNQLFDDFNGAASWRYGLGLDYDLRSNLFVGAESTWREISVLILDPDANGRMLEKTHEQTHRSYLHWLPIPQVALSVEFVYDKYSSEEGIFTSGGFPERLVTYSVPFGVRYFHPSGFFAGAGATYVNQDVNRAEGFPDGQDDFFLVDTAVGYRFPKRFGIVSLSISNLFDKGFKYMDDSFRESATQPSIGPYIPERQILARLTLNW